MNLAGLWRILQFEIEASCFCCFPGSLPSTSVSGVDCTTFRRSESGVMFCIVSSDWDRMERIRRLCKEYHNQNWAWMTSRRELLICPKIRCEQARPGGPDNSKDLHTMWTWLLDMDLRKMFSFSRTRLCLSRIETMSQRSLHQRRHSHWWIPVVGAFQRFGQTCTPYSF